MSNGDRNIARAMARVNMLRQRRHNSQSYNPPPLQGQAEHRETTHGGPMPLKQSPNQIEPQQPQDTPPAKKGSFREDRESHFGNNAGGHEALERDDD